jgi:hypothetical protein
MKLSASSISNYKDCNMRFKYHDVMRIRKVEDTVSQRRGNIWHRLQEFTGKTEEIVKYINEEYAELPVNRSYEDWMIERTIILNAFAGYSWYYEQQPLKVDVLVPEYEFEVPLYNVSVDKMLLHGKIDQIVRDQDGLLYVREFKTTSKSLDDNTYWSHLTLDVQTSLYLMAAQYLQSRGLLVQFGITPDEPLISRVLYNVWHKPSIAPTWLTQKDSKVFIDSGEYCGQKFEIIIPDMTESPQQQIIINNENAQFKPGSKKGTFAIYETPEMFGARLLQDITTRPVFYYQEREIAKTEQDMLKFANELFNVYRDIQFKIENDCWYSCEKQCNSRFRCEYFQVCSNNIKIDLDNIPIGFEKNEN